MHERIWTNINEPEQIRKYEVVWASKIHMKHICKNINNYEAARWKYNMKKYEPTWNNVNEDDELWANIK